MATWRPKYTYSSPNWDELSQELVALLQVTGPLVLCDIGGKFQTHFGYRLKLQGHKLSDCLAEGKLRGVRYSSNHTTLELTKASTLLATNPTSLASNASGGAPTSAEMSHALVTDLASWKVALHLICSPERVRGREEITLQGVCTDHPIALRLHGKRLGTKDGIISLIVVRASRRYNCDCTVQ